MRLDTSYYFPNDENGGVDVFAYKVGIETWNALPKIPDKAVFARGETFPCGIIHVFNLSSLVSTFIHAIKRTRFHQLSRLWLMGGIWSYFILICNECPN